MRVKMSKPPPPAPTASAIGPCPTVIKIVGRPGTGSLPSTIAPPDHPQKGDVTTQKNKIYYIALFGLTSLKFWGKARKKSLKQTNEHPKTKKKHQRYYCPLGLFYYSCSTIRGYTLFNARYSVMCKVYTGTLDIMIQVR